MEWGKEDKKEVVPIKDVPVILNFYSGLYIADIFTYFSDLFLSKVAVL